MVSPDSVGVSRVPTYLGYPWTHFRCRLRAFHPLWTNFPDRSANFHDIVSGSRNPGRQAVRFGLLRVRSPLLAEYRLISFPAVTEMFHFTASRLLNLWIQFRIAEHYFCCLYAAPRDLSQLYTSFIAYRCQGILHALLVA